MLTEKNDQDKKCTRIHDAPAVAETYKSSHNSLNDVIKHRADDDVINQVTAMHHTPAQTNDGITMPPKE